MEGYGKIAFFFCRCRYARTCESRERAKTTQMQAGHAGGWKNTQKFACLGNCGILIPERNRSKDRRSWVAGRFVR